MFYQEKDFIGYSHIQHLVPKFSPFNKKIALAIISACKKATTKKYDYGNKFNRKMMRNTKIQLPTKNSQIDFEFINTFVAELEAERIAELEAERIAELEAYLKATGLNDYELTEKEGIAINSFNDMNLGDYKLSDLFIIKGTKSLDSNAVDFINEGVNFIGRTFENNGIQGKISSRDFEPNEPNTITATVIGNYKYVKFQAEKYYCSQNINKLTPKPIFKKWNKDIAYFLVTHIQKFVSLYDGHQGGYKLDDINNHAIYLPTKNAQIDLDFIETLISAVKKLVIKDVVEYTNNKVNATKQLTAH